MTNPLVAAAFAYLANINIWVYVIGGAGFAYLCITQYIRDQDKIKSINLEAQKRADWQTKNPKGTDYDYEKHVEHMNWMLDD